MYSIGDLRNDVYEMPPRPLVQSAVAPRRRMDGSHRELNALAPPSQQRLACSALRAPLQFAAPILVMLNGEIGSVLPAFVASSAVFLLCLSKIIVGRNRELLLGQLGSRRGLRLRG
jgi:hypothetical protein